MGKQIAIVITHGYLDSDNGKTAHGLIRGSERFEIAAVIDRDHAGQDAGKILDGKHRDIPIFSTLAEFTGHHPQGAHTCIVGVALPGGQLPGPWKAHLREAIANGMNIVNGLHQTISDDPDLSAAARRHGVELIDVRKPPPLEQLHFWSGEIFNVTTPKIAVLGIDCAVGKRTTCKFVTDMCRENGIRAQMIYTGQTGWMQGHPYGFILDAVPNDFVCGELEHAIVSCQNDTDPELILIEGQSSLRNPSGPCGAELLLAANAKGVILQHTPFRGHFEGLEAFGCRLPEVEDELRLIKMYGATPLAVTLNGEGATEDDLAAYQQDLSTRLAVPVIRPLQEGVAALLPVVQRFMQTTGNASGS